MQPKDFETEKLQFEDDDDEYLDDEKQRRPKNGKNLRKFRHPRD